MKSHSSFLPGALRVGSIAFLVFTAATVRANPDPQEATETDTADMTASAHATDRVGDHFVSFAGSETNADALVTALHDGTTVTLTTTANGQTLTATFTPTTGTMSYRNVFLSLALAEAQLTKLGITQPTPADIQAALLGGSVTSGSGSAAVTTQLTGVLVLRGQNQGWGQIAQSLGVDLHTAVSAARLASDAGEAAEAGQAGETAATKDARVTDRLSDRFATFAGGESNATALVTGLRNGSAVSLTTTVNGQATTTTFTPSTGAMGYGNVALALSLAQKDLAQAGITQPTAAEIEAALNGGSVTTGSGATAVTTQLPGVLALRTQGQGWGQIAQTLGVSLHPMTEMDGDADDAAHVASASKAAAVASTTMPASAEDHAAAPAVAHWENSSAAAAHPPMGLSGARPDLGFEAHPQVPHFERPDIPVRPEIPGHH